ncbi:hypothetical protein ACMFMF_011209 [Clarireedia jacksonii]
MFEHVECRSPRQIPSIIYLPRNDDPNQARPHRSPSVYFIEFKPYAPKEVIDAHFVEMITIEQGSQSEDDLRATDPEGCTGVASGLSLKDVYRKGKLFVAAVGWDGLDESAKGNSTLAIDGAETHHVNFRFPIKGFRGLQMTVVSAPLWRSLQDRRKGL